MNTKLKTLMHQLLQSPRRFLVELALGIAFFFIAVWHSETSVWDNTKAQIVSSVNSDILWLFVPLMVLTFWLHRVNRWAYFASFFLFLPLMVLDLKPFLWTCGFAFTYVLAGILLIVGNRKMDNRPFAAHALHVATQMFFGLLITGILTMAVMAILASFFYIFGIEEPKYLYEHIIQFIWFVLAPQVCCTLIRQNEDEVAEPFKVLRLILNFILSPAVIIYTIILYTYFIKIAFEWDLPKGGVAWMAMGFITAALIGRVAQSILSQRYYDWFYNRFTLIAIPPLIMYWIGSIYRIRLYSFTESRFYLMVAGVLMTLFVLMLWKKRTRKYQLMAIIFGAATILFTYIPGISAKSIGLSCQKKRLTQLISDLKLADAKTGKLSDDIDMRRIKQDSLLCEQYKDVTSVINYVRKEIGKDEFKKQYGEWTHSVYSFNYIEDTVYVNTHESAAQEKVSYQRDYRYLVDRIYGFYIPKDINEAIDSLDVIISSEDKRYITDSLSLDDFCAICHFGLGLWMRNNWGLWGGSRLQRYFYDRKVTHPDDMSGLILKAYYKKKIQGLDYSVEDDIEPLTPMIDEVIESPLSKDVCETKRESERVGRTKGGTVYFMYPYGCSTKEEDKIRLKFNDKNYNQLPKGEITDIDYILERIKVKLIDTISPYGIIIFDGDIGSGEFSGIKRDFDNFIVNTPNRFYMQKGDELWFDMNSECWKTEKQLE